MTLPETKSYEKAIGRWNSPRIEIISLDGKAIARIPFAFLTGGGDDTWGYILPVVQQSVREMKGWIYLSGSPINLGLPLSPGVYVFAAAGEMSLNYISSRTKL